MRKSEMLECLINYYSEGNKARFSAHIGVKPQTVSAWISRNTFDAEVLYAKCVGVSADWLLSNGTGEMIRQKATVKTSGDFSPASFSGDVTVGATDAILAERVRHLEELLAEKERLIKVLLETRVSGWKPDKS